MKKQYLKKIWICLLCCSLTYVIGKIIFSEEENILVLILFGIGGIIYGDIYNKLFVNNKTFLNKGEEIMEIGDVVKVKYGKIQGMHNVAKKVTRMILPIQTAYWIKRNIVSVTQSCKELDKKRKELIIQYGKKESEYIKDLINELPPEKKEKISDENENLLKAYNERLEEINKENEQGLEEMYVPPQNNKTFKKEWKELMETEVEVTINPIELSNFGNIKISVEELTQIDFMICEDKLIKTANIIPK